MTSLPKELWRMIFYYSDKEEQHTLSQTNKYLHSLKYTKPYRYYCFWQNCEKGRTKYGKYGSKYVYFHHIEDCLKYCDKIKYTSYKGDKEAHYLEIGKVKQSKRHGYIKRTELVSFDLAWDDPCGIDSDNYSDSE